MIYYEVAGEGPNIVFVHEGVADSRMWEPQWEPFARAHRVVRYDMRGFGRSPLPPEPYSNAVDLIDLLGRLEIDRTTLVAASLGGRVALEVAVSKAELVSALVVAGTALPGHKWSAEVQTSWAEEDAALERGDIEAAVEVNLRTWVDGPRRSPDEVDAGVRELVGAMQRRAFELQIAAGDAAEEELLEPQLESRLGEIEQPALILVGEEDVSDMHEIARRLSRDLPNAQFGTISRAAHLAPLERPAEFNEVALEFLAVTAC